MHHGASQPSSGGISGQVAAQFRLHDSAGHVLCVFHTPQFTVSSAASCARSPLPPTQVELHGQRICNTRCTPCRRHSNSTSLSLPITNLVCKWAVSIHLVGLATHHHDAHATYFMLETRSASDVRASTLVECTHFYVCDYTACYPCLLLHPAQLPL